MNSEPTETSTYRSNPIGTQRVSPPIWPISLFFLAGLVIFILIVGRSEVGRWYYASAANALSERRYEDSVRAANAGLRWDSSYTDLISLRAMARYETGDFDGALQDYDEILAQAAKDEATNEQDIRPLAAKAQVLQRMQRFDEAVAAMDAVVAFRKDQFEQRNDSESEEEYAWSLNNRAYMQAQAGRQLEQALQDIQVALQLRGPREDPAMVDTLGYLQLLNGQSDAAVETLEKAVRGAAQEREFQLRQIRQVMRQVEDQRPFEIRLRQIDENYAILLHHRGQAYRAAGKQEQANADLEEAERLGYNPAKGIW